METSPYHHGDLKNALIEAGFKILKEEGLAGLSLRNVAREAGVSHSAPYAHFEDKQALIAAISTEAFRQLYQQVSAVFRDYRGEPQKLLVETAWEYLQFALNDPARFKLMFSGVLEQEKEYTEFVQISQETFFKLVEIVETCQQDGVLQAGAADLAAVVVWSKVHGFTSLLLEGQISRTVLKQAPLKELLVNIIQL